MKACFFFFVLLTVSISIAQNTKNDSITQLEEVILLDATKVKSATGIVPSSTIGAEVFQNYSPIDVTSSINQIPGVYVLSGALNTNRITIRGIGARTPFGTDKLRLYYNDIPVTNGSGFSTIETYDLENLGQIEVIKGPKGTAYGANLGGAILLKTKENKFESTSLSNNFTLGSFSLLKNNLSFDHRDNSFAFGLQYGHLETDGFRENNSFDRDGILLNTSYRFNAKNAIAFLLNYVDYTAQIPSSLSRSDFDENPRRAAANWLAAQGFESNKYTLVGASYTHSFSSRLENTSSIYYTYLDQYEARPFNIVDQFTNGYGFRTRFSGSLTLGQKSTRYSLGTELYHDEFNGDTFINRFRENNGNGSLLGNRIGNTKEFRRQLNIFGTFSISLTSNFNVQAGLNINATHYDFRDRFNSGLEDTSAERDFSTIALPSLSLTYNLSKGNIIYGNISRGFSNPGFEETLTPDGALNPEISQETGTNYELGTRILSIENRLRITMAIYRMDINNLLVAQRIEEDQFIGRNAGSTRHQGLEFDMNLIIPISTTLRVSPFLGYTFNDHSFVDFVDGDNNFSGNPLTGVPRHRLNSGVRIRHNDGFYWNTTHQYVGAIPLTDANLLSSESFNVFNTRLGYKRAFSKRLTGRLDFGINNLFNTNYARSVLINAVGFGGAEPRFFNPGDGRNYYGSLGLNYRL